MILHKSHGDIISMLILLQRDDQLLTQQPCSQLFAIPVCHRTCTLASSCIPAVEQLDFLSDYPTSISTTAGQQQPGVLSSWSMRSEQCWESIKENKVRLLIPSAFLYLIFFKIRNIPKEKCSVSFLCKGKVNYTDGFSKPAALVSVFK